ncbi:MAG: hypothetical protein FD152_3678 [Xanthobacteraceae bacterium]|nr:MAG: hypothetical protein FD152_3678 [Xanthobacteraceae bacterium]
MNTDQSTCITTEVHISVACECGATVRVSPDKEGLGLVEIDGGDDFGLLILTPEMALAIAPAIAAVAQTMTEGLR